MEYGKMSKSLLLKKYGPFIKENFGKEEFDYVKREDVDGVRSYIISLDPSLLKSMQVVYLLKRNMLIQLKL